MMSLLHELLDYHFPRLLVWRESSTSSHCRTSDEFSMNFVMITVKAGGTVIIHTYIDIEQCCVATITNSIWTCRKSFYSGLGHCVIALTTDL